MNENKEERDYYWYLGKHLIIFLILTILNKHESQGKGFTAYILIKKIKQASNNKINLRAGTVYPLIQNMEESGLVKKEIGVQKSRSTGTYRERAIYSITNFGKSEFLEMKKEWNEIQDFIKTFIEDLS